MRLPSFHHSPPQHLLICPTRLAPSFLAHAHSCHPDITQRLLIRSAFVALLTFLAICMPFFNVVVGLVGR